MTKSDIYWWRWGIGVVTVIRLVRFLFVNGNTEKYISNITSVTCAGAEWWSLLTLRTVQICTTAMSTLKQLWTARPQTGNHTSHIHTINDTSQPIILTANYYKIASIFLFVNFQKYLVLSAEFSRYYSVEHCLWNH